MAEDLVLLSTMEEDGSALEIGFRSAPGVIDVSRLRKSAMRGSRLPGRWCLSRHPDWPPGRRNGVAPGADPVSTRPGGFRRVFRLLPL
jgi:hypothetical protein